ncbi:hypothetical protein [Planctomyces sp. SH-PL14]|jgi:hypothetical protein|uniref:hypothetical protein n=1 Tax=Planctomyces sp. SH-PL14 TaxID=1632864 RepID=UPI00078B60A3|nr:hypothetical protein [Planctomyces sp. SH-PL14]AMV21830.1 hypothetical protein VT03_28265 [Planctomyces sp. SH-PL14]
MEFDFEVDPELDLAIGTELSMDEAEGEYEIEDFSSMGVDPLIPTPAKPGSEDKVRMLAARYAAGLPLWHDEDCYDHGPVDSSVLAGLGEEAPEEDDF